MLELLDIGTGPLAPHKLFLCLKQIFDGNDTLVGMNELDAGHIIEASPPPRLLPLLQKVKNAYLLWYGYYQAIPKVHRHSLGQRVDTLFVEIMETIAAASFLVRAEKRPYVRLAIRKTDTLKVLLMLLWETKSLDNKKYAALSVKVEEIGKMLGGWNGQLTKLDPAKKRGEK